MKPYRLLILTATTGGGHQDRAVALSSWASEIYGEDVEVRIFRPLEEGGQTPIGQFGVWLYNMIQRFAPILHMVYFYIIEVIGDFQNDNFIGRGPYERLLREFRPQMIVSVHDFLNKGYFDLAHEVLPKARCATYCGEYSGGAGFSKHWVSTQADRWVGRTEGALRMAYRLGVPPEKMDGFTFFLPPDEVAALSVSRRDFRLDPKKLTLLFANGRNGAQDHLAYLYALEPYKDRIQAIVVCGLNETLRRHVDAWQQETGFPAIVEGYSSRMRAYMRISDVVIYRGGSNTATRAFHEACPMWLDASSGVMPQEKLTIDFFVRGGAAEIISSPTALKLKIENELKGTGRLAALRTGITALREKYLFPRTEQFFREFLEWGFSAKKEEVLEASIETV